MLLPHIGFWAGRSYNGSTADSGSVYLGSNPSLPAQDLTIMMNTKQIKKFLLACNKAGYAGGEEKKWVKEKDGSTTIPFRMGQWESHDSFFGGEPYGGRTVVFYKKKPVWIMVYYGWVAEGINPDSVYTILREALMRMSEDAPFRGPQKHKSYVNKWIGSVDRFSGEEKITQKGKLVYKANYMGGWVDKRRGV